MMVGDDPTRTPSRTGGCGGRPPCRSTLGHSAARHHHRMCLGIWILGVDATVAWASAVHECTEVCGRGRGYGCWMLDAGCWVKFMTIYTYIYCIVCVCEMWFVLRASWFVVRGSTWFVKLCSAGIACPRGDLTRSSDERSDAESVSPSEEARGYILGIAHAERDVVRVIDSVPA